MLVIKNLTGAVDLIYNGYPQLSGYLPNILSNVFFCVQQKEMNTGGTT